MISIDEMNVMLDEIAASFPQELFKDLNGGILLLPETKIDPAGRGNDLYILGQYCHGGNMGRYISIYYGSFGQIYGHRSPKKIQEELIKTLKHEFTHHLESLAGEKDLEIEDAEYLRKYLSKLKP